MKLTGYEVIAGYFSENIRSAMLKVSSEDRKNISEIRVHSGRAVVYVYPDCIKFLSSSGRILNNYRDSECIRITAMDIAKAVNSLCRYSVHSCSKELAEGYFVINGGIRVGCAGTYSESSSGTIRDFNGLNFRISRNADGCAEQLKSLLGRGESILICGGVNSGKTTVLRDFCRICGNRYKVSLIDERNEISSVYGGRPENDVGVLTDILSGCTRSRGISTAIRTLSPDYIFCDEISELCDVSAILSGTGSGVKFVATVHAENLQGLYRRKVTAELISADVFDYAVMLEGSGNPGKIKEVRRLRGSA